MHNFGKRSAENIAAAIGQRPGFTNSSSPGQFGLSMALSRILHSVAPSPIHLTQELKLRGHAPQIIFAEQKEVDPII